MQRLTHALNSQLLGALERAFPEAAAGTPLDPQLGPASKPEFCDFQANGALALARPLRQAPRVIATAIVEQLQAVPGFAALCLPPQIAGPGSIHLTLRPALRAPEVVDFSSPNIAKELHVGHLRSTIIGAASPGNQPPSA